MERTVAVDLILAIAVGVEGSMDSASSTVWNDNQYAHCMQILPHAIENERLARFAMVSHELSVLADSEHDVAIYDGSHLTPVIELNSGVWAQDDNVSESCVDIAEEVDLLSALQQFVTAPAVIAVPNTTHQRTCAQFWAIMSATSRCAAMTSI